VAFRLVTACCNRLGATDHRFHFLGTHDQAGLLRQSIRFGGCATLIVITAAIGYLFGFFGAVIWNERHRR
jgi:hypothetical protein